MELTKVDGQLIHLLQQRKNLSSIELANGFLSIAKDQSDFSGFPVNNFIESLVKCSISKLKRKPEQFQDVFITIEEIIEIFTKGKFFSHPFLTSVRYLSNVEFFRRYLVGQKSNSDCLMPISDLFQT